MPRISYAFFTLAALCGTTGMVWGIWMGSSEQMASYPGHAHLNALGWLGLSVMGAFYALAAGSAPRRLAWANFTFSALGATTLPLGIALILTGHRDAVPLAIVGGLLALIGMLLFLAAILTAWRRSEHA